MYTIQDLKYLTEQLNKYCDAYYNKSESIISDKEYDILYDRLVEMEEETGITLSNSPTINVGYKVSSGLEEVTHCFPPMLSLDKTKEYSKIKKFLDNKPGLLMAKMDGLTVRITYRDGKIYRAETRGNGTVGEDITHNIYVVKDVPISIPVNSEVIVDGEVIVTRDNFIKLKNKFLDENGKVYKNARNFASGSIRLHDSKKASERCLQFVAWKFVKGSEYKHFSSRLNHLEEYGFNVTPYTEITSNMNEENYKVGVDMIQCICNKYNYPIDGCVFSFNVCDYMESLGYTAHHSKAQIAYKFYDEKYDTIVRDIDWTMGKTGVITPTAIFDTVEIDGTEVSRASLHNLTIMKQLNVRKDCSARVFKANMIIPQVDSVDDDGVADFEIPQTCPICGYSTAICQENDSEVLMCLNRNCRGKLLGKCCTFVSKQGLDIDGLGESSLDTFIHFGFITKLSDIFRLRDHYHFICNMEGWTVYSTDKLMDSIEKSRYVSMENFISALSITNIGLTSAKTIAKHFNYNLEDFYDAITGHYMWSYIDGFGEKTEQDIWDWYHDNKDEFEELFSYVEIKSNINKNIITDSPVSGKTFCVTGSFSWGKRDEIKERVEALGGIFVSGVTKKTEILFVGENAGSKLKKAEELGITIYTNEDLVDLIGE